ncbi:hypothetical protein Acr_07g0004320 [Actinidia rufa]|uniref:Plant heme peroxidase family profile domain-containing protein n=1 Tax=Actinidia rufa TaxID=165716 RepID=A0A7J0EUR6_9ERIC|nr:hypothetical protein Acr_07g0004320 [Actinidia rufa]
MPDPPLDFHVARKLRGACAGVDNTEPTVVMDRFTPSRLDYYYMGLLQNKGLFTSDQTPLNNAFTRQHVIANTGYMFWRKKFVTEMIQDGRSRGYKRTEP